MVNYEGDLNLKATELRLGLPGSDEPEKDSCSYSSLRRSNKRSSPEATEEDSTINKSNSNGFDATRDDQDHVPPSK